MLHLCKYSPNRWRSYHRYLLYQLVFNIINVHADYIIFVYTFEIGQNETFGSSLKFFYGAFVPHLFPDIYMYLGSHRRILGHKPNEKFFTKVFSEKNLVV